MKTIKSILLLQILVFIFSCGPSSEEKAVLQKTHDDSLRLVTENETKRRIEEEKRIADSIENAKAMQLQRENEIKATIKGLKNRIAEKRTEIRLANEQLAKIKEFQIMRTPEEKQRQIENQYKRIQFLEEEYERLKDDLGSIESGKDIEKIIQAYGYNNMMQKEIQDSISAAQAARN